MSDASSQVIEEVVEEKLHSFDLFVAVTGIIALSLLSWRLFLDPTCVTVELIDMFDLGICAIFFWDFLRKLFTAKSKIKYLLTWGPIDLLASVPAAQFANTRIIHTLHWPHLFRIMQGIRAIKVIHAIVHAVRKNKRTAMVVTGIVIAESTIVGCCFAVLHFESQDPTANITSAADVLWWSVVTMSTVGYGDFYPVTVGGRFMAVLLMFVGIGLFAMLAGVFADTLRSAATEITTKTKL
ncbi:MAG: potassium channel family protein [Phycisphaerales bacterium]|nr:potassium channel family protein [Planctomycetota bacterium]MBL6997346.1 potassium channel family protein [Phycisphaerales bacterium]